MQHKKYTEGEELTAEELETISDELIQAKFDREKRKIWEAKLKNDFDVERTSSNKKTRFSFVKLAIAAAFVCIVGIVTYSIIIFSTPSYELVLEESVENLISIDNHAVVTRGDETIDMLVLAAISAYKEKNYAESIDIWEKIISTENMTASGYYNLALCYQQKAVNKPEKAITYLLKARNSKTVQQEATWALALAYLQLGEKEKAKVILREIVLAKAYKHQKAMELLELL